MSVSSFWLQLQSTCHCQQGARGQNQNCLCQKQTRKLPTKIFHCGLSCTSYHESNLFFIFSSSCFPPTFGLPFSYLINGLQVHHQAGPLPDPNQTLMMVSHPDTVVWCVPTHRIMSSHWLAIHKENHLIGQFYKHIFLVHFGNTQNNVIWLVNFGNTQKILQFLVGTSLVMVNFLLMMLFGKRVRGVDCL